MKRAFCLMAGLAVMAIAGAAFAEEVPEALVSTCVKMKERSHACGERFIGAMIDLRTKYQPRVRKWLEEKGRDKLREIGLRELAEDGAGPQESRRAKCAQAVAKRRPSDEGRAVMDGCIAKTDCEEYVRCVIPALEKYLFQGGLATPDPSIRK